MFPSQKYRCGQSSLEYLALAVFVMMGIIIGGPYVVRGINAHFKTLEEGALDSERENITQGDFTSHDFSGCDCSALNFARCGDDASFIDGAPCKARQAIYRRKCSPLGCEDDLIRDGRLPDGMEKCMNDNTHGCCEPEQSGPCANDPASITGACRSARGDSREWIKICDSPISTRVVECRPDDSCHYQCQAKGTNATWCNEAVLNVNLIAPDVPVTYRNSGGCTTPGAYCEAQCVPPYVTDTRYLLGCCGGGAGGIIINGGPYTAAMQSDSFDADGPDCIATPKDSKLAYPDEIQVYETITYILSNAGVDGAALVNQSQTDVYAAGRSDYYWSSVASEDVFYAIVSYNAAVTATFGVYDMGSVATAVTLSAPDGGVKYTGDGTSLHPYLGGKFTANTPVGFIYNTTATYTNFYSDPVLNGGVGYSLDPMLSFQLPALAGKTIWINTASGVVPMPLTADTYLLSFECNLSSSSDFDYNDTFILVTKIKPIP